MMRLIEGLFSNGHLSFVHMYACVLDSESAHHNESIGKNRPDFKNAVQNVRKFLFIIF